MASELLRIKGVFLLVLIVGLATAKPSRFPEAQISSEGDKNDLIDPGFLKAWERYDLLKKLASDLENGGNFNNINENSIERIFRNPEMKRQGRSYRQCYFNPISCFKK